MSAARRGESPQRLQQRAAVLPFDPPEKETAKLRSQRRLQQRAALPLARSADPTDEIRWTLVTERPTMVYDWHRGEMVNEILLADGMRIPASGQVPLLDCHRRWSVDDVLGHVDRFAETTSGGYPARSGVVHFAGDDRSAIVASKVREGHITDGSVGYRVTKSLYIPEDKTATIAGRTFTGPVRVAYEWHLREFSLAPIGADSLTKVSA